MAGSVFGKKQMSAGHHAVTRRFPGNEGRIEELLERDDDFVSLCDDLAAAEDALALTETLPPGLREERRAECAGWIDELTVEIRKVLTSAKVIRIDRRTPP